MSSILLPVSGAHAQPRAQDHALYKNLFEEKITQVRRTRDKADDIELLKEMQQSVGKIPDSPEVQRLIYVGIIDLAVGADQYADAVSAAEELQRRFPDEPAADPQRVIAILDKGYRSSPRQEKKAVGEMLVARLVADAREKADNSQLDEASKTYRRARLVAFDIGSSLFESIQLGIDRVERDMRTQSRVSELKAALEKNPADAAAARELTAVYMLAMADPSLAMQVVQATGDAALVQVVGLAAQPIDALQADDAMKVADWYIAQRGADEYGLSQAYPAVALQRAMVYYDHTLANYPARDARYLRVSQSRQQAGEELAKLASTSTAADTSASPWVDLIARFDANTHGLGKKLAKEGGVIASDEADFVLPIKPKGGYDLKLKFTFLGGKDGLNFCLPYEGRNLTLTFSRFEHTRTELLGLKENTEGKHMLSPGRKVEMLIQVRPTSDGNVGVQLTANGSILIQWQGKPGSLQVNSEKLTPEAFKGGVRVSCGGRFKFESIEYKDLSKAD